MDKAIHVGKHLLAPAIAVYLFWISTWGTPMAEKYALTATMVLMFLGIAYAVAWMHRSWSQTP